MEMINRYVFAVTKSLPEKQRLDIEKELRTLIDDMIEQNQEEGSYESKVQEVLLELGDPEVLADNYRGSKRYLIGPQYYEKYVLILKIVFGAVLAGISIAIFVESIFSNQQKIFDIVPDYFGAVYSGLLQAFALTTIAFMIAERNSMNMIKGRSEKNTWSPSQLPAVPDKKAIIPISEPIVSIIFTTIFIVLLYSTPQLLAAYISSDSGMTVIPVFSFEVIKGYRILLIFILVLSIFKEVLKLYSRRWTLKLSIIIAALVVVTTVMILAIFTNNSIWNPNFSNEIVKHMNLNFDFISIWPKIKNTFIAAIVLTSAIDISITLYKGTRYNKIMKF